MNKSFKSLKFTISIYRHPSNCLECTANYFKNIFLNQGVQVIPVVKV